MARVGEKNKKISRYRDVENNKKSTIRDEEMTTQQRDLCIAIVYSGDILTTREWAKRYELKPVRVAKWLKLRVIKEYIDKLRNEKKLRILRKDKNGKLIQFARKLSEINIEGKSQIDNFIKYMNLYEKANQNNPVQTKQDIETLEKELRKMKVLALGERLNDTNTRGLPEQNIEEGSM